MTTTVRDPATKVAPESLTPLVIATTSLADARRARRWFRDRSILSEITRGSRGQTKISVHVPHHSVSGVGPAEGTMAETIRRSLIELLPEEGRKVWMANIVVEIGAGRWKIREADSLQHALNAIAHARVSGSVGATDIRDSTRVGGTKVVEGDVVQINSDGTERQPYTLSY